MKLLVLCTAYPDEFGCKALTFVHVRNLHYIKQGFDVTVINFSTSESYDLEGVRILSLSDYRLLSNKRDFDVLVSHAANVRHHRSFLREFGVLYPNKVFFFHGHEIRYLASSYGKPYHFKKSNILKDLFQTGYDRFKIAVWRRYFLGEGRDDKLVFVSECLKSEFCQNFRIDPAALAFRSYVISNCVGEAFEKANYICEGERKYDFITIRSNLDASNYCIDLVNDLARANPTYKFLVIGKGSFFSYFQKANNLDWIDSTITHNEMIEYLQLSRCALMPTKVDAQGLAMCEMATLGIPLISSDIEVCREVLRNFSRVILLDNDTFTRCNVEQCLAKLESMPFKHKVRDYYADETVRREIELLKSIVKQ